MPDGFGGNSSSGRYDSAFRPKERKRDLISERKGQQRRVRESLPAITSAAEAQAHIKYLKSQIELQTLLPDLNKNQF